MVTLSHANSTPVISLSKATGRLLRWWRPARQ